MNLSTCEHDNENCTICFPKHNDCTDMSPINKLSREGWNVDIFIDYDGDVEFEAHCGDSNCHHQKEYDPIDGHGYSHVTVDCEPGRSFKDSLDLLVEVCGKVVSGAPYGAIQASGDTNE